LQARITTLEADAKNFDVARLGASEQSAGVQKKIHALEEDIKQKVLIPSRPFLVAFLVHLPPPPQNEQITTIKGSLESTRTTLNAMSTKSNALREEKKELNGTRLASDLIGPRRFA